MRRVSPFKNGRLIAIQNAEAIGTRLGLSPLASSLRNWRPAEPPTFSPLFGRKCVLFLSVKIVASMLGEIALGVCHHSIDGFLFEISKAYLDLRTNWLIVFTSNVWTFDRLQSPYFFSSSCRVFKPNKKKILGFSFWRLPFVSHVVTGKEAQHASPFATSPIPPLLLQIRSHDSPRHDHSSNRHVSEKRKKNPLTTVTFNRPAERPAKVVPFLSTRA